MEPPPHRWFDSFLSFSVRLRSFGNPSRIISRLEGQSGRTPFSIPFVRH